MCFLFVFPVSSIPIFFDKGGSSMRLFKGPRFLLLIPILSFAKAEPLQASYSSSQACKNNRIFYKEEDSDENLLPRDYFANAPAEGHLGIGGSHARPLEKPIEPILIWVPKPEIDIGIIFCNELEFLCKNTERKALGFSLDFSINGKEYKKTYRKTVENLPGLFHQTGRSEDNQDDETLKTSFFRSDDKTINLRIDLIGVNRVYLNSVDFYYGDLPHRVSRVYILPAHDGNRNDVGYNKDTCHYFDDTYNLKVGTKGEFTLYSPYGSFYGKDYLEECFGVRRYPEDKAVITDNNIVSGEGGYYFTEAYKADIGTEYLVTLQSSYRAYNEKIILHRIVGDKKPPTLYFPKGKHLNRSYKSDLTKHESFLGERLITDNYDSDIQTEVLNLDGSSLKENGCGDFQCLLIARDSFGNQSQEEILLTLYDDIPPILKAEYSDIFVGRDIPLKEGELLSFFSCKDEIDPKSERTVLENTYSQRWDKEGLYRFTVEGKDAKGNKAEKTRKIHVKKSFGEYYRREGFISRLEGSERTLEECISLFIEAGYLEDKPYKRIRQMEGENITKDRKPGRYKIRVSLMGEDGKETLLSFVLSVKEKNTLEIIEPAEEESFLDKAIAFFLRIWKAIVDFFSGLFRYFKK